MPRMGRTRQSRKDLPRRMYFDHGAYYFTPKAGPKINLGRDLGDALRKYAEIVQPAATRKNIGAVMDAYIAQKLPRLAPRTQADYLDAIGRLRPVFGAMWPEDLEPRHGYQYQHARGADVRANRELAVLSNVMQQAIEEGIINANPLKQVRRAKESPREREVLDEEVAGLLAHTPAWLDAYILIKSLTGLRQGDMLRLGKFSKRDDGLFVLTGKRQKRLLFAWTPALREAVAMAEALRRRPSEARWFPISGSGFKSAWARAMKKTVAGGGESFAENDLRAKVAGQALEMGLDATSMLAHSSDAVTRRHYIRGTRKVQPLR